MWLKENELHLVLTMRKKLLKLVFPFSWPGDRWQPRLVCSFSGSNRSLIISGKPYTFRKGYQIGAQPKIKNQGGRLASPETVITTCHKEILRLARACQEVFLSSHAKSLLLSAGEPEASHEGSDYRRIPLHPLLWKDDPPRGSAWVITFHHLRQYQQKPAWVPATSAKPSGPK